MLLELGLTAEHHEERRTGIGGSDAAAIMSGDPKRLTELWMIKTGRLPAEDLSHVLPVQLGLYTEPFNAHWFEVCTGREVTNRSKRARSPDYDFMRVTLDGITTTENGALAVFEAKHVNQFTNMDECIQRYQPQLHHAMVVTGLEWATLSVLAGTLKYECHDIPKDPWYAAELIDREATFWACVKTDTPPKEMLPVLAPVPPSKWRSIDLKGNNLAAIHAPIWLREKEPARRFKAAEEALKSLCAPDVGEARGYGVAVKRDRRGYLTVREAK